MAWELGFDVITTSEFQPFLQVGQQQGEGLSGTRMKLSMNLFQSFAVHVSVDLSG